MPYVLTASHFAGFFVAKQKNESYLSLPISLFETETNRVYLYIQSVSYPRHCQAHREQFTLQGLAKELRFKPPLRSLDDLF